MKNYLGKLFPSLSVGHTGCVKTKESQSYKPGGGGAGVVQNLAKLACDLFLGVAFFLFLFFPVGAIRKMKEAESTCLGVAVMWNPVLSLESLTKTSPCATFLCGNLRLLREGHPQLQDQSLGLRPAPCQWLKRLGCMPSGHDLLLSSSVPLNPGLSDQSLHLHHVTRHAALLLLML